MMRLSVAAMCGFVVGGCATASDKDTTPRSQAFERLMQLEGVDSARVGYAGTLSPAAEAFRTVLSEHDAELQFGDLFDRARLGGRLVALCGLKMTRSSRYQSAAYALRGSQEHVDGKQGCIVGLKRPVAEVLRDIEAGDLCDSYAGTKQ